MLGMLKKLPVSERIFLTVARRKKHAEMTRALIYSDINEALFFFLYNFTFEPRNWMEIRGQKSVGRSNKSSSPTLTLNVAQDEILH